MTTRAGFIAAAGAVAVGGCARRANGIVGLSQADLLRLAGRLTCFPVHVDRYDARLRDIVNDVQPAGFLLFTSSTTSPDDVRRVVHALGNPGARRPFVAADEEGGAVQRLPTPMPLPSAMAVCATGSLALARDFGASIGQLCRAVGVDTVLGPVLDAAARTPRWGRGRSVMIRLASPRLPGASFAGCIGPRFER